VICYQVLPGPPPSFTPVSFCEKSLLIRSLITEEVFQTGLTRSTGLKRGSSYIFVEQQGNLLQPLTSAAALCASELANGCKKIPIKFCEEPFFWKMVDQLTVQTPFHTSILQKYLDLSMFYSHNI
jgi:hypothetical protein